jgi:hypothetical protein
MVACPNCKRRIFSRQDMLYAALSGTARCRACGHAARLDISFRWIFSCVLALVLPYALLYGGLFYSGHLFVISTFLILGTWAALSWLSFPFLALETAPRSEALDRRQSAVIVAVLLVSALLIDGYIRTRIE